MGVEVANLLTESIREAKVVGILAGNEFSTSTREGMIQRSGKPEIHLMLKEANAAIPRSPGFHDG